MPVFSRAKCYRIIRISTGATEYVGGTTSKYLSKRMGAHRMDSKKYPNNPFYKHVLETGGWDDRRIVLLELFPCSSRDELKAREQHWIDQHEGLFNAIRANADPRDKVAYGKKYYAEKRTRILAQQRNYRVIKKNKKKCLAELKLRIKRW